jgi:CBS domain-containing protein
MSLSRFCRKKLVSLPPEASARDAAERMREHHVGAVIVTEGEVPIGIVTDRDLVMRVIVARKDPATTAVREVMSGDVVTVREDEQLDDVVQRMRAAKVRRLPIVSAAGGRLVGVVALDDVAVLLAAELQEAASAVRGDRGP